MLPDIKVRSMFSPVEHVRKPEIDNIFLDMFVDIEEEALKEVRVRGIRKEDVQSFTEDLSSLLSSYAKNIEHTV